MWHELTPISGTTPENKWHNLIPIAGTTPENAWHDLVPIDVTPPDPWPDVPVVWLFATHVNFVDPIVFTGGIR